MPVNNTMLQELQIRKLEHLFRIIDFDHNGLLQKSDFQSIADNVAIFTGIIEDDDHDNLLREEGNMIWGFIQAYFQQPNLQNIDSKQWIEFMENFFFGADDEVLDQNITFIVNRLQSVFDKNKDQLISRLEFMSIFVSFRVEVRFANQCFKAMDLNGDGFISTDELVHAAMDFFKSNDPDALGNKLFGELGSSHFQSVKVQY